MEQFNRIELRGNVGNAKISAVGSGRVANFSLATNHMYKSRNGDAVIETTWFNVVAWEGREVKDIDKIKVGATVCLTGRVRNYKYTPSDGGEERQGYEVLATKLSVEGQD